MPLRRSNVGYAFVRFKSAASAQLCFHLCHGKPFGTSLQSKSCRVCVANVQDAKGVASASRDFAP